MRSYFGLFRPNQDGIARKQAQVPKKRKGKAHYQRGHSAYYSGFKITTSTFLISILSLFITSHKHCAFTIMFFLGEQEPVCYICHADESFWQSGSLLFIVVLKDKDHYQRGHSTHYSGFELATAYLRLGLLGKILYLHKRDLASLARYCTYAVETWHPWQDIVPTHLRLGILGKILYLHI